MIRAVTHEELARDFQWIDMRPLSPYFSDMEMLGCYAEDEVSLLALLAFVRCTQGFEILGIYSRESCGIEEAFRALLSALAAMSRESGLPASIKFFDTRPDCGALCKAASESGFVRFSGLYFAYTFLDGATRLRWEDFMGRKGKFFLRLAEKGYENKTLADIPAADRLLLCDAIKKEFNYDIDGAGSKVPLDEKNCFFAFRGGELTAFCAVRRASPTQLIFDFGAAKKRERRSGAFMLPLCSFISGNFVQNAQTVVYLFHEDNVEMLNLARGTLRVVIDSVKYKMNYCYVPDGNFHPPGGFDGRARETW
jgi:hypothetical protein